jgi:hypothetical protein
MPQEELYPTKELRYKICEFLLNRRIIEVGIGTPLRIKVRDMEFLLEYTNTADRDERVNALADELISLNSEGFNDSVKRPVIQILDMSILNNLQNAFTRDLILTIRCASKNLEDYITELEQRTIAVVRRESNSVEFEELPNGGVKISLTNKEMKVGKTKNSFDLRINVVKIVYDEKSITIYDLVDQLQELEGGNRSNIQMRSIADTIRGLNKRSNKIFGCPIIEKANNCFSWNL